MAQDCPTKNYLEMLSLGMSLDAINFSAYIQANMSIYTNRKNPGTQSIYIEQSENFAKDSNTTSREAIFLGTF